MKSKALKSNAELIAVVKDALENKYPLAFSVIKPAEGEACEIVQGVSIHDVPNIMIIALVNSLEDIAEQTRAELRAELQTYLITKKAKENLQ